MEGRGIGGKCVSTRRDGVAPGERTSKTGVEMATGWFKKKPLMAHV